MIITKTECDALAVMVAQGEGSLHTILPKGSVSVGIRELCDTPDNEWARLEVERMRAAEAARCNYCGNCGQWVGGPLTCCDKSDDFALVTAADAYAVRERYRQHKKEAECRIK